MTGDASGADLADRVAGASQAVCIKLGTGGDWTDSCIETGTIQLGFGALPDELCARLGDASQADWLARLKEIAEEGGHKRPTMTVNQVRAFYVAPVTTIWFTFHRRRLWWCFSLEGVRTDGCRLSPGASRYRRVDGCWMDRPVGGGRPLWMAELSGKLTMKAGYRGTLLTLHDSDLARLKVRLQGQLSLEAQAVERDRSVLAGSLAAAISTLNDRDFETLADLVLSRAGLRRSTPVGETQKTIDFEGSALFSGDQIHVQVKAGLAPKKEQEQELLDGLAKLASEGRVVLVANVDHQTFGDTDPVQLIDRTDLAGYCLDYGLTDWVLKKAG